MERHQAVHHQLLNSLARTSPTEVPVVANYCATFLKPEMLHIYRQITALNRVRAIALARKRENAALFPFEPVCLLPRSRLHFLRRIWASDVRRAPWCLARGEVAAVLRILARHNARLLHIFFGNIAVQLRPLIHAWNGPTIVSFHGADAGVDLENRAHRRATIEMLGMVRRVLVRSESLRAALLALGCPSEKIVLQRTGIPLEEFAFQARHLPPRGEWQLFQAGRLIPKKGFTTTLRAFALFRRAFPAARLTIAGEGPAMSSLQALARELQVTDALTWRGFVAPRELRDLLYGSHIFLHPSETGPDGNREGVPNAMLEAMASGLPVFATRHGGIAEAVEDGISGILVDEGDYESLASALLTAARNPGQLAQLGHAGSGRVAQEFEQRAQTQRLEEIYLHEIAQPDATLCTTCRVAHANRSVR